MSQSVWQLSCQENYKWLDGKERDTDSVPFPCVPFVFNSKSSSNGTMNTSFIQDISEVTVKQRRTWTYSPYCSKISNSNQWAFTLLWRDGRCQANSLQCNHSPEREEWAEHLESNWFLQSTTTQSERPYIWVVSSLRDLQTLCCNGVCQWQWRNTWFCEQFIVIEITCFLWLLTTLPSAEHLEQTLSIQIGSDTNYTGTNEMLKPAIPAWQNLSQTKLKTFFHLQHLTCSVCSSRIGPV